MQFDVVIKRSERKTVSVRITRELEVIVGAPLWMREKSIFEFIEKHKEWIQRHLAIQKVKNENSRNFTEDQVRQLKKRAEEIVSERVSLYSEKMGVAPDGIKITCAATRWGSCSAKNSLCFSYRVALLEAELIDYIVVHELAHIRFKNHGLRFYSEIERFMPDYRDRIKKIREIQVELGV